MRKGVLINAVLASICAVAWFVLMGIFAAPEKWLSIDYIYTSVFLFTLIIPAAINEWIRRKFLVAGRYVLYFLGVATCIFVGAMFNEFVFSHLIDYILPGYYFISYYDYPDIVKFFAAFIGLATLVALSVEWFSLQHTAKRLAVAEKDKTMAEFRALANQVNPHFLFNSLAVVYGLSLKDSRETSDAIIKLSDILRYLIYRTEGQTTTIDSEAKVVRDYLDLQKYRVHPTTQVNYTEEINDRDASIIPMLFLPLVENSFKHGVHTDVSNAFVNINLLQSGANIRFSIANSIPSSQVVAREKGSGLDNLRDRLRMMYPGKHTLEIIHNENQFRVNLSITTTT